VATEHSYCLISFEPPRPDPAGIVLVMLRAVVWGTLIMLEIACRPAAGDLPRAPAPPVVATPPTDVLVADDPDAAWVRAHYVKREARIPMRDGVALFTAIYEPRDAAGPVPILLKRTPYGVGPYGEDELPDHLGPSRTLMERGYVIVEQDVRGCFMSEGEFVNMRPHRPDDAGIDESSDTYDTIEWLLADRFARGLTMRAVLYGSPDGFARRTAQTMPLTGVHVHATRTTS